MLPLPDFDAVLARARAAGVARIIVTGASAAGQCVAAGAQAVKDRMAGFVAEAAAPAAAASAGASAEASNVAPATSEPAWAQRMRRRQ